MRVAGLLCLMLAVATPGLAATVEDDVTAALGQRLFPALTAVGRGQATPEVRSLLAARERRQAQCGDDAACKVDAARWNRQEIDAMATLAAPGRPPEAIRRELAGLNSILEVYGKGAASRYPRIDGPMGEAGSQRLAADVATPWRSAKSAAARRSRRLDASIGLALALIDVNDRLDAIAFEPIEVASTRPPSPKAKTLDWSRYRYTAIIVLGAGPEDPLTPLSARGKLHVKVAAQRYFDGQAPFIILSGAAVHPRGTRHVEAVEMRRALVERYGVPEHALVIEPYARHTTTNLRNASRLLMAMKAPPERDALVLSDPKHIDYVVGAEFTERNRTELGYLPGTLGKRTSPFDVPFRPSPDSAKVDPLDPLDP